MKSDPTPVLNIISDHCQASLNIYLSKYGAVAYHRFWNLLRSDLQRLQPDQVEAYLANPARKISEMGNLGSELNKAFFTGEKNKNKNLAALIFATLEIDAALKLDEATCDVSKKQALKAKLTILGG
jgi:hypothetical protein